MCFLLPSRLCMNSSLSSFALFATMSTMSLLIFPCPLEKAEFKGSKVHDTQFYPSGGQFIVCLFFRHPVLSLSFNLSMWMLLLLTDARLRSIIKTWYHKATSVILFPLLNITLTLHYIAVGVKLNFCAVWGKWKKIFKPELFHMCSGSSALMTEVKSCQ